MPLEKIAEKFNLEDEEIVFRYPKLGDLNDLLDLINSLVKERAMIMIQKRKTRKEEIKWLSEKKEVFWY